MEAQHEVSVVVVEELCVAVLAVESVSVFFAEHAKFVGTFGSWFAGGNQKS